MKKNAMGIQILFFIMMSLILIWIIFFGFSRLNEVEKTISKEDEIALKAKLKEAFDYCSDPVNIGSFQRLSLKGEKFNSICFNGHLSSELDNYPELKNELKTLAESGHNIVLLQTDFSLSGNSEEYSLNEYNIFGAIKVDSLGYNKGFCWFDFENTYQKEIEIDCVK